MVECPKGMIKRKGSKRKSHTRKSYTKKNGTNVKAAKVKQSRMGPACTPDKGAPGKGPKILPPLGDELHLSKYGYSLKDNVQSRHKSLKKASKKHGTLKVLKRTNLIANYTADQDNKKKLRSDVEFLKKEYLHEKERMIGRQKKVTKRKTKKPQKKSSKK